MVLPRSHYGLGGSGTTPRHAAGETRENIVNAPARPRPKPRRAVRREQLSDEVAARLRADIMTGTLRPGTFIRLDETAAQLGVSITPVREALRTLRGEGMVQLEPHRGHVVVPLSRGDIEDIFWLQGTIAKELAATAAERITDAEIEELERLNDGLAAAVDRLDPEEVAAAEFAFHRAFNRSTSRIKLAWFLLHVARYLPPHIYAGDAQWGAEAVASHRELIAALRRRDVDTVVRLTGGQFTDGAQRLIARLDEIGLWS
jgi:DNA-binding GntR family transcriptional regulator